MKEELSEIFQKAAAELGVPLSAPQLADFSLYMEELKKWSKRINLTSLKEDTDIVSKHFVDSLSVVSTIPMGSFCLDLGSGGGFPGVPIKIARPDLRFLLLEATGKKVAFLNHIIRELKLKNIRTLQQRAEAQGFIDIMQGQLDIVIARAFSDPEKLVRVGSPYLRKGGKLISMQGKAGNAINPSSVELKRLKLKHERDISFELPITGGERNIKMYTKI